MDLVIQLGDTAPTAELSEQLERFIAWVRLARVKLSHAVRTTAQTAAAFEEDVRTTISYLDARPILGAADVGRADAIRHLRGGDEGREFAVQMLDAYRARLGRFGQTIYLLEPDVKSGKGGLRDLHLTRWVGLVRSDGVDVATAHAPALGWGEQEIAAMGSTPQGQSAMLRYVVELQASPPARERSELLVEASRQDAARARAEAERLRIQAQIQAEEAERLRLAAESEYGARQEVEGVLEGVASDQAAKLRAARARQAELERREAELLRSLEDDD